MSEIKNVENEKNDSKMNEEKIVVLTDYSPIVKDLRIVPSKTKYGTFYQIQVTLEGGAVIRTRCDQNLVQFIDLVIKNGDKPYKQKVLVKEFNEEKQREFTCVKFVLISGNVFRYFIDRADVNTIEYLYQKYQANKK